MKSSLEIFKELLNWLEKYQEEHTNDSSLESFIIWLNSRLFSEEKAEDLHGAEHLDLELSFSLVMQNRFYKAYAKKVLGDPKRTNYNIVIIPEEMAILESERSLEVLKQYKIPVKGVIVNKVIPDNMHCPFCREKRKQQLKRIGEIKKRFVR